MNQRGFTPILMVLIALLAFILGAILWGQYLNYSSLKGSPLTSVMPSAAASVEPAINWPTYSNSEFLVKYPPNYSIQENHSGPVPKFPSEFLLVNLLGQSIDVSIASSDNFKHLTLQNALGAGPGVGYLEEFLQGHTIIKTQVDNIDAVRVDGLDVGGGGGESGLAVDSDVIILRDNKIYELTLKDTDPSARDIFDQILATFKFTQ